MLYDISCCVINCLNAKCDVENLIPYNILDFRNNAWTTIAECLRILERYVSISLTKMLRFQYLQEPFCTFDYKMLTNVSVHLVKGKLG